MWRDSWNTPLRIEPADWSQGRDGFYLVRSAGPDRQFNSADDLSIYLEARSGSVASQAGGQPGGSLHLEMNMIAAR